MKQRGCSYFRLGLEREYTVCNFELKEEIQWFLKRSGEVCWSHKRRERPTGHSSRPVSSSCVFSDRRTTSQKGPRSRRKICANSLWQYPYYTQSSPSKNENVNYIFVYLQVFRCLSCGSIYDWCDPPSKEKSTLFKMKCNTNQNYIKKIRQGYLVYRHINLPGLFHKKPILFEGH